MDRTTDGRGASRRALHLAAGALALGTLVFAGLMASSGPEVAVVRDLLVYNLVHLIATLAAAMRASVERRLGREWGSAARIGDT